MRWTAPGCWTWTRRSSRCMTAKRQSATSDKLRSSYPGWIAGSLDRWIAGSLGRVAALHWVSEQAAAMTARTCSGELVAIGARDFLDQPEHAQAPELARHCCWGKVQLGKQVGPRQPWMLNSPCCKVRSSVWSAAQKKLIPLTDGSAPTRGWLRPLQVALARGGVFQAGQEGQVALIAAQQGLAQVDQAVDRLSSAAPTRGWSTHAARLPRLMHITPQRAAAATLAP